MKNLCPLSELPFGSSGRVILLKTHGNTRARMFDLGLVNGTIVSSELKSPLGDPTAYSVRGALIALRQKDADNIFVKPF